ncbi:MAG TPA: hypothetical protein VMV46_04640 [Thermoanaerobaculia bacterium]|nr:hypothetical protein [Thermoanaerobaculia bacterium]
MTDPRATSSASPAPEADASPSLRLFAAPAVVRRGRFLALFLLVNWGVMGIYVLSQGIRSLVGGLAFALGLFALIGGLTHLRASRLAPGLPVVEAAGDRLRFRRYSSAETATLDLREVEAVLARERDAIALRLRGGEEVRVPGLALSPEDREQLGDLLEERAGRGREGT